MKCKLVINKDSGNCNNLDVATLLQQLGDNVQVEEIDQNSNWSAEGFDTIVVCGGDGTLHNAIEKCKNKRLLYAPCGTLNEAAQTQKQVTSLGKVNDSLFSYVCAAGSFTEIGYTTQNRHKKRWKCLAYIPQIFKTYHCHQIAAQIDADGKRLDGTYTLLMVLKSHRCFGFCFNKDYHRTGKNYLVAVRGFGKDCLWHRVQIFFPFFRIFFCGATPKTTKNWLLVPFDQLTITLAQPQNFCLDGEKMQLGGMLKFSQYVPNIPIEVLPTPFLKHKSNCNGARPQRATK